MNTNRWAVTLSAAAVLSFASGDALANTHTVTVGGWALKGGVAGHWGEDFGGIAHTTADTDSVELPIPLIFDAEAGYPTDVPYGTNVNVRVRYNVPNMNGTTCTRLYGIIDVEGSGASFYGGASSCLTVLGNPSGDVSINFGGTNTTSSVYVPGFTSVCPAGASYCYDNYKGGYVFLYVTATGQTGISSITYSEDHA